jgi:hypothetical protein
MFQKFFDFIDTFIDGFDNINTEEELSVLSFKLLNILKEELTENLTDDMTENEKIFDDIMNEPGLWSKIGEKIKKAVKNKKELLKFLLYLSILINEFQKRLKQKQKEGKKYKDFDKIINKYMKLIKEVLDNKDLDETIRKKQIYELKKAMKKEIEYLEHDR